MLSFFKKRTISDGEITKISRQYTNSNNEIQIGQEAALAELGYNDAKELKETIYGNVDEFNSSLCALLKPCFSDFLRTIRDPEKPATLENLNVVYIDGIFVQNPTSDNVYVVRVEFNPTVPHCNLATLIGLW